MKKLAIIIPAYNEEKRISSTLSEYLNFFQNNVEIIVVLNGCKDKTEEVVKKFQKKYSEVLRIINILESIGKGGAVQTGFKSSNAEIVGFVDADGSTSAKEYQKLIDSLENNDGVIASRWLKGSVMKNRTLLRKSASKIFIWIVKIIFGMPYSDTQCGAKVFKREKILNLLPKLQETGMAFDVELLYRAYQNNFKIKEVATYWVDKPGSQILGSPFRVIFKGLAMVKILFKIKNKKYE